MYDMHCHILPEVDDGARSMDMALHMLRQAAEEGITAVFATPHCRPDLWEYDPEHLRQVTEDLRRLAAEQQIPVEIHLGTEVRYSSSVPDWLAEGRCLTMADTDYVLVEFAVEDPIARMEKAINSLMAAGYYPIIAHVERYEALRHGIKQLELWVQRGVIIQCNASALAGQDGWRTSRFVGKLLQRGLVHLVGTDAHSDGWRKPELFRCIQTLEKKYGSQLVQELMLDNPRRLLEGQL